MLNPCIYCVHYDDCKPEDNMKDYCEIFCPVDGFTEDDYLNAIIEERRASFRDEWFIYIESND